MSPSLLALCGQDVLTLRPAVTVLVIGDIGRWRKGSTCECVVAAASGECYGFAGCTAFVGVPLP